MLHQPGRLYQDMHCSVSGRHTVICLTEREIHFFCRGKEEQQSGRYCQVCSQGHAAAFGCLIVLLDVFAELCRRSEVKEEWSLQGRRKRFKGWGTAHAWTPCVFPS